MGGKGDPIPDLMSRPHREREEGEGDGLLPPRRPLVGRRRIPPAIPRRDLRDRGRESKRIRGDRDIESEKGGCRNHTGHGGGRRRPGAAGESEYWRPPCEEAG